MRLASLVASCCVVKVDGVGPPFVGAVSPGPPDLLPYVTVHVPLIDRLTPVTWIVEPEIPTEPHVDVVAPCADAVVDGVASPLDCDRELA